MYMAYFPLELVFNLCILKTYLKHNKTDTHMLAAKMRMSAVTWVFYIKKEMKL